VVRGTFSPARAWRPAVVARLARTLGGTTRPARRVTTKNPMPALTWETTTNPAPSETELVAAGVFSYGQSLAKEGNASPIACFARIEGTLVAGAAGRTEYNRLFVASLWVSEELRNQGLGTETLARLEAEATRLGCRTALLETLSDSAARLYARLGYQTLAEIKEYVGPFNRYIMLKSLPSAEAPSAA
jgi:ribosomal protein S18 acetylase RimI-like enzyme